MKTWSEYERLQSDDLNANFQGLADGSEIEANAIDYTKITNPYKFKAYRSANYEATSGGVVQLNSEAFDLNGDFDTSTYSYTVPVTGYYQFDFRVGHETTAGVGYYATLYRSGAQVMRGSSNIAAYTNTSGWGGSVGGGLLYCTAGEVIYLYWIGTNQTIQGGEAYTYWSGYLVL